jgi:hypothetical protein
MKIRVPTTRMKDIGTMDATLRLPTAGRIKHGMKTTCCVCGKAITDEFFIGGFKAGERNMMMHEACLPEGEPKP